MWVEHLLYVQPFLKYLENFIEREAAEYWLGTDGLEKQTSAFDKGAASHVAKGKQTVVAILQCTIQDLMSRILKLWNWALVGREPWDLLSDATLE